MNARASTTIFLPLTGSMRRRIEQTIEGLTALLDEIDGDCDLESSNDDEPYLGWSVSGAGSGLDVGDDREDGEDPGEEDDPGEDSDADEDDDPAEEDAADFDFPDDMEDSGNSAEFSS